MRGRGSPCSRQRCRRGRGEGRRTPTARLLSLIHLLWLAVSASGRGLCLGTSWVATTTTTKGGRRCCRRRPGVASPSAAPPRGEAAGLRTPRLLLHLRRGSNLHQHRGANPRPTRLAAALACGAAARTPGAAHRSPRAARWTRAAAQAPLRTTLLPRDAPPLLRPRTAQSQARAASSCATRPPSRRRRPSARACGLPLGGLQRALRRGGGRGTREAASR